MQTQDPLEMAQKEVTEELGTIKDQKANIISQVITKLGRPKGLMKKTATQISGCSWRVNLWCKAFNEERNIEETKILHSYFVTTDKSGEIIKTSPEIRPTYK